ncbi:MAG: hypothetical protein M1541_17695, partial [Acidobacteria bacterium]|nr:hypothetical protein [Acidobacteriota bacterium]
MNDDSLSGFDLEAEFVDRGAGPVPLCDALEFERGHLALPTILLPSPATPNGITAKLIRRRHSAAISSGDPFAISVMVRAV